MVHRRSSPGSTSLRGGQPERVFSESHRLLEVQPLTIGAISVQEPEAPELWARVRALAKILNAESLRHIRGGGLM